MATTRKKSIHDIDRQAARLAAMDERRGGKRHAKIYQIANRYKDNIVNKRGVKRVLTTRSANPYTAIFIDGDKKFARSTYMGTPNRNKESDQSEHMSKSNVGG